MSRCSNWQSAAHPESAGFPDPCRDFRPESPCSRFLPSPLSTLVNYWHQFLNRPGTAPYRPELRRPRIPPWKSEFLGITLNRPYTLTGPAIPLDPRLSTYSSPTSNVPVLFRRFLGRRYDDIWPDASLGGSRFRYRWEMNSWVFGLEAQGDWAGLSGSNPSTVPAFAGDINRSRMDAFCLFTGEIGHAWNTTLVYVKGGAAVVADRNDILFGGTVAATAPGDNRWGGTVGAGVEYSFYPDWSVAVEYDHIFIGNNLSTFTTPAGTFFGTDRIRGDADP